MQTFRFTEPSANGVLLVGDFTAWQQRPIRMERGDDGIWTTTVKLPPGKHCYRFIVDGEWRNDPECQQRVPNPYGGDNMVREVGGGAVPGIDWNKLNKAFRSFDVVTVTDVMGSDGLPDLEVARKFVMALRQSSCLAIQIQDATKEARRDALVVKCREMLALYQNAAVTQDFEHHVEDAKVVERGYRELFQTMRESEIWKQPPATQAWGMVLRAEGEFVHVKQEVEKQIAKLAEQRHPSLDPRQLRLHDENGRQVRPDAVINGIVKNAGDTLLTLAYVHGWFDKSGAIVLPKEV